MLLLLWLIRLGCVFDCVIGDCSFGVWIVVNLSVVIVAFRRGSFVVCGGLRVLECVLVRGVIMFVGGVGCVVCDGLCGE